MRPVTFGDCSALGGDLVMSPLAAAPEPTPFANFGKWCLGHDVAGQAESLRHGHYVAAHLVDANFSPNSHGGKGLATDFMPRCNHCRSIRRWHDHGANALRRSRSWMREHADRWVKLDRADTAEVVLAMMDIGGITEQSLADVIVASIGEPCPGMCAKEVDGRIVRHTIGRVAELHIDVKNPLEPLTIENIGILCISCNTAKGDMPFTEFVWKRRAQLIAWQAAIDNPDYRGSEQPPLEGFPGA